MVRNKKTCILVIALLALLSSVALAIDPPEIRLAGDRQYGPWGCDACLVDSPMADAATKAYVNSYLNSYKQNYTFFNFAPGDQITVCNATHCTTYTVSDTGDLHGAMPVERFAKPGSRGGAGGGPRPGGTRSTGGDLAPVGGCTFKCTPVVGVGKPKQV